VTELVATTSWQTIALDHDGMLCRHSFGDEPHLHEYTKAETVARLLPGAAGLLAAGDPSDENGWHLAAAVVRTIGLKERSFVYEWKRNDEGVSPGQATGRVGGRKQRPNRTWDKGPDEG
jgi:hypothetical protein